MDGRDAKDRTVPARLAGRPRAEAHDVWDHDHHEHDHAHDHSHGAPSPPPPDPATVLISARGLTLTRGERPILQGIDIDIGTREIVTLIGPNGAGKTTLVRVLLGLIGPDRGQVTRRPGLRIGYAPQRFDVDRAIPLTVARFVTLGKPAGAEAVERALGDVGAARLAERQLSELSGGELQRVVLARALVRSPQLLVLDEPVRGVDYAGEAELYTLIGQLRSERGLGVLLVSHDLHVVMAQSDRVICLNRHVCCSGVPQSVAQHPEYARLFGAQAARAFALYQHQHDHRHDLAGEPEGSTAGGRQVHERADTPPRDRPPRDGPGRPGSDTPET
jgi:zinc transport system ATP-binding protein